MLKRPMIFILVMLISTAPSISYGAILLDKAVAVVNQEVITWGELYKAMEFEASDRLRDLKDEEKRKIFKENEAAFLDVLIDMRLQLQVARQLGINASPEEVDDIIENIKKKYSIKDTASLTEFLKNEGFTFDEYKRKIAEQIVLNRVVAQQVKSKIVVSEKEIEKYMKDNAALLTGEEYRLRQIFFKKPVNEADRKGVEERAHSILQRLNTGEDFSSLAMKYSEDPSGRAGGDLGFIKKQYMAKEFVNIVSQMKAGEISQPFWTEGGLHIIKLEEKKDVQSEADLKETVRSKLVEEKFSRMYKNWIRSLRENAYIEIRL